MLELENVSCSYGSFDVIKNLNLKLEKNKFYCVVGVNGSGKTTLLNSIAYQNSYVGNIYLNNVLLKTLNRKNIAKKIAYFRQSPALDFPYTVYDTLMLSRYAYMTGLIKRPSINDIKTVEKNLRLFDLNHIKDSLVSNLSGGQKQRVFLAKAICQQTDVLLLDEPTNNLDIKFQVEILDHVKKWINKKDSIVIAVLHDLSMVVRYADEIILLDDATIFHFPDTKSFIKSDIIKSVFKFDVTNFMIENHFNWTK